MSLSFFSVFYPPSNSNASISVSHCFHSTLGRVLLTFLSCCYTLLVLPLSALVLHLGLQQWRRRSSGPSSSTMTHSDFFTYNMAAVELTAALSTTFYYSSGHAAGLALMFFTWPGQNLFPVLACVDQYLAVVHPIAYRGWKAGGGVVVRNLSACCVWALGLLWTNVVILLNPESFYKYATLTFVLVVSLVTMVFCSLSVLRVLIRPPPGAVAGGGPTRQRVLRTVAVLMAVLWWKFGGNVVVTLMRFSTVVGVKCAVEAGSFLLYLPSSAVLPLMFIRRAGKRPACQRGAGPGPGPGPGPR